MATPGSRLNNENYLNWLRGSLSLLFLKEGIEAFTDKRVTDFHERLRGIVSQQPGQSQEALCHTCSYYEVRRHKNTWKVKCSSKTCNTWLKQILRFHADGKNPDLARTNLKPQLWPTQPWEVAKCFLPCGSERLTAAKDADIAAVLKLMRSCLYMYTFTDRSLVMEVLDMRHRLMHSNNMTTSDDQLKRDTDKIIQLLNSLVYLTQEESDIAKRSIGNINKLRDKTLDVTLNREVIVLTSRMHAIEGELAILKDTCKDYKIVGNLVTKTVEELNSLTKEYRETKAEIDQLKKTRDSFEDFLQRNDLVCDVAKLSKRIDEHGHRFDLQDARIDQLDERLGQQDERLDEQDERLGQQDDKLGQLNETIGQQAERLGRQDKRLNQQVERLDLQDERLCLQDESIGLQDERLGLQDERLSLQDERLGLQNERLGQQAQKMDQQGQRLDNQDRRLSEMEEIIKNTKDTTADRDVGSWEEQCSELQAVLMQHYKETCLLVQNPVNNTSIGMEYIYVEPAVRILRQSKGRDGLKNVQDDVERLSCRKIFYTDNYRARQIYITGDAGLGKSMLCRHLVQLWCEALGECVSVESEESDTDSSEESDTDSLLSSWRKEEKRKARAMRQEEKRKHRREENKHILSQFEFLFYVTLRDSLSEYTISEMIHSQILQHYDDIKHVQASDVLKKECCLVIVDGLDEWVCPKGRSVPHFVNPGIPGRNLLNKNNVFLTTTRPWKFDVLELNDSDVDKHAELCGLDKMSTSQFCSKIFKLLNKSKARRKNKKEFFRTLKQKGLGHFKTIPVILIQLICLWYDDQELNKSQVQLYGAMLNFLLKKGQKKLTGHTILLPWSAHSKVLINKCLMSHPYCQSHQKLINSLSKVAFEALIDKTKENQLVFESSQMEIYGVDEDSVNLCLRYGILSQNKMFDKCAVNEKKLSFLHKKFQEFLASVYIANSNDVPGEHVAKRLTDICSTLKGCIEMSQVWMFVCGMSSHIASQLLKHFTNVVTSDYDKQIQNYRQSLHGQGLIQDIQTFVADCVLEGENNDHKFDDISLVDLYVDRRTFSLVECLLLGNVVSCIKSMYIDTRNMTVDESTHISGLLLHSLAVQKLYLFDPKSHISSVTLTVFVQNCCEHLTCLDLNSQVTLTYTKVTSICHSISKCLMALRLRHVTLTHVHMVKLLNALSQSATIRQLDLSLHCTDHASPKCRPRIDMSTMTQLQTLVLWRMSVDNLPTMSQCVERVDLRWVTLSVTALCEFSRRISQKIYHVNVELYHVTARVENEDRVDVETFLRSCPGLRVRHCYKYYDLINTMDIRFHSLASVRL